MRLLLALAALSGGLAVALGAFAAHGATDRAADLLRTGAHYQIVHALAVFACAHAAPGGRLAPALFLAGSALFAGSLYAMAFGAPGWLGMVTPLGGLCFIVGWAALAWAVWANKAG